MIPLLVKYNAIAEQLRDAVGINYRTATTT